MLNTALWLFTGRHRCHTVLNVLTSSRVPAVTLLLCCADTATINVHAVLFSQPLCCANFYKDIYSSNVSVKTKYCNIGLLILCSGA